MNGKKEKSRKRSFLQSIGPTMLCSCLSSLGGKSSTRHSPLGRRRLRHKTTETLSPLSSLINDAHCGSDFVFHSGASALVGRVKQKHAPRGELSAAHKRPPCDSTIERLM